MNQEPPPPRQIHCVLGPADFVQLRSSLILDIDQNGVVWVSLPSPAAAAAAAKTAAAVAATTSTKPTTTTSSTSTTISTTIPILTSPFSTHAAPSPTEAHTLGLYDRELLCELMDLRSSFDVVPRSRYSAARWESNQYECLSKPGCNPFLNRSALKLANINMIMPLTPVSLPSTALSPVSMTFVDLCGGPGGFSEYLLRRQGPAAEVHGWGMTLENCDCPWDRHKLADWIVEEDEEGESEKDEDKDENGDNHAPASKRRKTAPAMARTLRFCYGQDRRGDLCRPENIQYLRAFLPGRVDVVVADGGFAEARARFDQEAMMLPLLVSEVSAMFYILRKGGLFVCKFFDVTLPATVQLIGLLGLLFESVAIVKPVTSRPASSERYVLGRGFRGEGGENEQNKEVALLLEKMFARVQAGQTDGLSEEEEEEGNEGGVATSLGNLLAPGSAFAAWLRIVNNSLMRAQIKACYAIHEKLNTKDEEEEEEVQREGDVVVGCQEKEEQKQEQEQKEQETEKETKKREKEKETMDMEAYRRLWDLDRIL